MKYGLDFGTTNTSIAIKDGNTGKVLPIDLNAPDPRVIRTMLFFLRRELVISDKVPQERLNSLTFKKEELTFEGEQKILIGYEAISKYTEENKFRKAGIIRKILTGNWVIPGKGADPVPEYYLDIDYGTGRLIHSIKTALKSAIYKGTSIFGKFYTLEDLIATFVNQIKALADKQVVEPTDQLVVGRPVYFSYDPEEDKAAQDRLEQALIQAGFKDIKFIFEPIAAAEQFIATTNQKNQLVFVFDFGGGTLDTALVQAGDPSKVLSADGVYIGGDLLNADIVESKLWEYFGSKALWSDQGLPMPINLYQALSSWYNITNLNNPETIQTLERLRYKNTDPEALDRFKYLIQANLGIDLYEAVEKAKKALSTAPTAQIVFQSGPINLDLIITRAEFEEIIQQRVDEIKEVVLRTLQTAKVKPEEVDVVVRTGGSSLIPIFETMLSEVFEKEKIKQFETFTSIAAGLALLE